MNLKNHNHFEDISLIIKDIARGAKGAKNLSIEDAYQLFCKILDNKIDDFQLGALLIGLRVKTESDDELLGFKKALDDKTPQIELLQNDKPLIVIPSYNGTRRQPNLMPLLALRLAKLGIPVLIHGRYDFETRINPLDQIQQLNIPIANTLDHASELIHQQNIAFIHLADLLPNLDYLLSLRNRLGLRNSGHSLVKLLDPAIGRSIKLVAVTHSEYLVKMKTVLLKDAGKALLMRGTEGEAYANPRRRPQLEIFFNHQSEIAYPAEEGGTPPIEDYPDSIENAKNPLFVKQILDGQIKTPQPIVDQLDTVIKLINY